MSSASDSQNDIVDVTGSSSESESSSSSSSGFSSRTHNMPLSVVRQAQSVALQNASPEPSTSVLNSYEREEDVVDEHTLANSPWVIIMSSLVGRPSDRIRERYFIPPEFEIIMPDPRSRMHQPPPGCLAFNVNMLEAGLRFPLEASVENILCKIDLCPAQLVPNSIRHILSFVIVTKYFDIEPSFANFWKLYSITSSKRSGEQGWFYLTPRPRCKFLTDLPSNVGPWKENFLFIREPRTQPWRLSRQWKHGKPEPQDIGSATLDESFFLLLDNHWLKTSVLLQEPTLCLLGLSPAPISPSCSLGNELVLSSSRHVFVRDLSCWQ